MPESGDKKGITEYLNDAWKIAGSEGTAYGNPQSHPNIVPWVQGMKNLGVSRKKFPSSIEAMVKRATKSDEPFRISPVVDFYNAVSLANMVPEGEVSYADGHKIITRHFIWKQSKHCLLTDKTRNILFVSEILPELPEDTAKSIAACFKEGLNKYFKEFIYHGVLYNFIKRGRKTLIEKLITKKLRRIKPKPFVRSLLM